jgi:hypothetical protein
MNLNKPQNLIPLVPNWILWIQGICFSILYAIWVLPETILIRHICLITGALLSLWVIYQYRHCFFQRSAIPVWLIVALFAWATFHLFFLANDFAAQYEEFATIWKRTALGVIFALGFGIALINNTLTNHQQGRLWSLIYLGLLAPTLIYIIKFTLTHKAAQWGMVVPAYWFLYPESAPFYLPKTAYVCFCVPSLGIALGQLAVNIQRHHSYKLANLFYLLTIPAVLFVFYGENIKNGVIHGSVLIAIFLGALLFSNFRQHWVPKLLVLSFVLGISIILVGGSIRANDSWRTFVADSKVVRDTQTYQHWKYNGSQGYPNNELGTTVSVTNYERMAWGKEGIKLIFQNPF